MSPDLAAELIEIVPKILLHIRQRVKVHATGDLTMPQLRILSQLKKDGLSNSELADRCGVDITSMSRMAANLVRRGYIARSINRQDKRSIKLELSSKGRREQEAVFSAVKVWVAKAMEGLSATEKDQLFQGIKVLQRLVDLMEGASRSDL